MCRLTPRRPDERAYPELVCCRVMSRRPGAVRGSVRQRRARPVQLVVPCCVNASEPDWLGGRGTAGGHRRDADDHDPSREHVRQPRDSLGGRGP